MMLWFCQKEGEGRWMWVETDDVAIQKKEDEIGPGTGISYLGPTKRDLRTDTGTEVRTTQAGEPGVASGGRRYERD